MWGHGNRERRTAPAVRYNTAITKTDRDETPPLKSLSVLRQWEPVFVNLRQYLMRWSVLLTALAGCSSTPPSDAVLYTQALTEDPLSMEERLALCDQIAALDLQAECVSSALSRTNIPSEERCARIPASRWQDECWFDYAELQAHRLPPAAAAAACKRANTYMRSCVGHVLSQQVLALHRTEPSVEQINALAQAWSQSLQDPTAITDTWRFFWELEFQGTVDPRRCEQAEDPRACNEAVVSRFRVQLEQLLHADRGRWCAADPCQTLLAAWDSPPGDALKQMLDEMERNILDSQCH